LLCAKTEYVQILAIWNIFGRQTAANLAIESATPLPQRDRPQHPQNFGVPLLMHMIRPGVTKIHQIWCDNKWWSSQCFI